MARYQSLVDSKFDAKEGQDRGDAMVAIERYNPRLKGVLTKDYARSGLDSSASANSST